MWSGYQKLIPINTTLLKSIINFAKVFIHLCISGNDLHYHSDERLNYFAFFLKYCGYKSNARSRHDVILEAVLAFSIIFITFLLIW